MQKKAKLDTVLNTKGKNENNQNHQTCLGIDNNSLNAGVTNTENYNTIFCTNDRDNIHTSCEEQDNSNDVGAMENNDLDKNSGFKDNDCKDETADIHAKKEQSHNAYYCVELGGNINGNNKTDSPSTDFIKYNKGIQNTNTHSSSGESNDYDESNETSDSSIEKLDKTYRQSTKSKVNNRKHSGTKRNSNNNEINTGNNSKNVVNNEKCDICGQFLNDPELLYYQGHPQDAVEEYVALTDDKLVVTAGKLVVHTGFYVKVYIAWDSSFSVDRLTVIVFGRLI